VWSAAPSQDASLQGSRFSVAVADSRTAVSFGGKAAKGVAMGQACPPPHHHHHHHHQTGRQPSSRL
jgi:hypothetical protein